ncbi:MAG: helix-turn-helix domain-containing protein [Floccifex sp.]
MQAEYEIIKTNFQVPAILAVFDHTYFSTYQITEAAPHWHRSIEFSLVLDGTIHLKTIFNDYVFQKNEFIFVNSAFVHRLYSEDSKKAKVFVVIISYEFLKQMYPDIDQIIFSNEKIKEHKDLFLKIFQEMLQIMKNHEPYRDVLLHAKITEIVYWLLRNCQSEERRDLSISKKLKYIKLLDFITSHYKEKLTLSRMAKECHVSEEYFSREFKKITGVTFSMYLKQYRIYQCMQDVLYSNKTITDIAMEYGFANVKSFITSFEEFYHVSPYQYRKMSRNDNNKDNN